MRLLWTRADSMLVGNMPRHPLILRPSCLEAAALNLAVSHHPPLGPLLDSLAYHLPEPAKGAPPLGIQVHPVHVPCLVVSEFEHLVTVLTLVPLVEVHLLVADELLLGPEAPPASSLSAEERSEDVVLAMSPHIGPVNCPKATDCTGELLKIIRAVSFVSGNRA